MRSRSPGADARRARGRRVKIMLPLRRRVRLFSSADGREHRLGIFSLADWRRRGRAGRGSNGKTGAMPERSQPLRCFDCYRLRRDPIFFDDYFRERPNITICVETLTAAE